MVATASDSAPVQSLTPAKLHCIAVRAETFLHPGVGQVLGSVDLPVAREAGTGMPYVAGSSMKGALRDRVESFDKKAEAKVWFGDDSPGGSTSAGAVIVSDLRLVALPLRRLDKAFAYVTSPYLLKRLEQDIFLATGNTINLPASVPAHDQALIFETSTPRFVIEDLAFQSAQGDAALLTALASLGFPNVDEPLLKARLVVVSNKAMSWLTRYALPTRMRNALTDKKTVLRGHLWSEEYLPPETLFSLLIGQRPNVPGAPLANFQTFMKNSAKGLMQVGGNETVGQGWLRWNVG